MSTVADSSPLIAFQDIGRVGLLRDLFREILVPPAVAREVRTVALPDWVKVVPLQAAVPVKISGKVLGAGETEAISLALEVHPKRIVLDDGAARSVAISCGLNVVGVLGILLSAKELGLIRSIRADIDALRKARFRIAPQLYREVLSRAGEL